MDQASFEMALEEAEWLAERIAAGAADTLIAWLVTTRAELSSVSEAPWEDPATAEAPDGIRDVVQNAKLFSLVMHGAALLYNLLIAERAKAEQVDPAGESLAHYRDELGEWADQVNGMAGELARWRHSDFWALVRANNPRVPLLTQNFVENWIGLATRDAEGIGDNQPARRMVSARERLLKGSQSRLTNERLLHEWSGGSGVGRLTFRWLQVKVLLGDIADGRSAHAGA
jgi:hypothetical protein